MQVVHVSRAKTATYIDFRRIIYKESYLWLLQEHDELGNASRLRAGARFNSAAMVAVLITSVEVLSSSRRGDQETCAPRICRRRRSGNLQDALVKLLTSKGDPSLLKHLEPVSKQMNAVASKTPHLIIKTLDFNKIVPISNTKT